jgi:hypothetical protein
MGLLAQSDRTVRRPDRRQSSPSPPMNTCRPPTRSRQARNLPATNRNANVAAPRMSGLVRRRASPGLMTRGTRTKLLFNRVNDKSGRASNRALRWYAAGMHQRAGANSSTKRRAVPSERRRSWQKRVPACSDVSAAPTNAHGVATSSTSIPPDTCLLPRRVTTACGARSTKAKA